MLHNILKCERTNQAGFFLTNLEVNIFNNIGKHYGLFVLCNTSRKRDFMSRELNPDHSMEGAFRYAFYAP